jgi:hypothetical protein
VNLHESACEGSYFFSGKMFRVPQNPAVRSCVWLVIGLSAATVCWFYMHRILLPWEDYVLLQPRGLLKTQLGDLYPRWIGTRELLLYGKNPYSPEVSHEIQVGFYGHPIEQSLDKPTSGIVDEQRFAYPVYVVFLLAPTIHTDFAHLQAWAPVVLAGAIALAVCLWVSVLRWRPPALESAALILLVLASPQVVQGLRLRQPGLFVAFLVALGCWCVSRRHYLAAGTVLALATIKPHMVLLVLVWLAVWCTGEWRKRWPLAAGFCGTLAILTVAGEALVPGWPVYFLDGITAYRKYFPNSISLVRLFLGVWIGGAVSIVVLALLMADGWRNRRVAEDSPEFVRTLTLFLIATCFVLPIMTVSNQVLLLLPVVTFIRDWSEITRFWRRVIVVFLAWPSVIQAVLLVHPPRLDSTNQLPLLPSVLTLVLPFLVLILKFTHRHSQPAPVT